MYNSTSGSSMPQLVAPPPPDGNVHAAMMETDKLSQMLHERLDILEQRFSPVLRPSPPKATGQQASVPQPVRSGLADAIAMQNSRLASIIGHVEDLLDRCDI